MRPRKSHSKSRNGCVSCKQRHVKKRPLCSSCAVRGRQCEYVTASPSRVTSLDTSLASTQAQKHSQGRFRITLLAHEEFENQNAPQISSVITPFALNASDLELFHLFVTSTYSTIRENKAMQRVLQINAPRIALEYTFLMNGILSVAALHMSTLRPENRDQYILAGSRYQATALAPFRKALANMTEDNYRPVFLFAILLIHFDFGSPKSPTTLGLTDNNQKIAEWVHLLRGGHVILANVWAMLRESDIADIVRLPHSIDCSPDTALDPEVQNRLLDLARLCSSEKETLSEPSVLCSATYPAVQHETQLISLNSGTTVNSGESTTVPSMSTHPRKPHGYPKLEPPVYAAATLDIVRCFLRPKYPLSEAQAYHCAVSDLEKCFTMVNCLSNASECIISSIFTWPVIVSQSYLDLLTKRTPQALIILAHYCVLLSYLDDYWWMQGWSRHVLDTIEGILSVEWKQWIQWPAKVLRSRQAEKKAQETFKPV